LREDAFRPSCHEKGRGFESHQPLSRSTSGALRAP
jgi:hypothetical protein